MRRIKERDYEHIFKDKKRDAVALFANNNNIPVPSMIIIEDNLLLKEGVEREKFWIQKYKDDGWNLLNTNNGGSIGGILRGMWNDHDKCKEEAKKYINRKQFK